MNTYLDFFFSSYILASLAWNSRSTPGHYHHFLLYRAIIPNALKRLNAIKIWCKLSYVYIPSNQILWYGFIHIIKTYNQIIFQWVKFSHHNSINLWMRCTVFSQNYKHVCWTMLGALHVTRSSPNLIKSSLVSLLNKSRQVSLFALTKCKSMDTHIHIL